MGVRDMEAQNTRGHSGNARTICYLLMHEYCDITYDGIGKLFGRSQSAVTASVGHLRDSIKQGTHLAGKYNACKAECERISEIMSKGVSLAILKREIDQARVDIELARRQIAACNERISNARSKLEEMERIVK